MTTAEQTSEKTGLRWWIVNVMSLLLLFCVVAILLAAVVVPKVSGSQAYTVLTSSMEPTYPPGTLIVVKPGDVQSMGIGEPVTYQIASGLPEVITHRIVAVGFDAENRRVYTTQGDNNPRPDESPVKPEQIRGRVWYSIPYLGYVNNWITGERRTTAVYVIAGGLVAFALYQFASAGIDRSRRKLQS
ncbi:signal peptidase I [Rhodococcus fascians]|uniref:signal peptidase I n=1 Tax=Nocardiaceae TaxID=85025 RepID=UPI000B9C3298|nr:MULTISPECIES: signal peptidase I [Rhodococcus]MBY3792350.1 signal peptidase I [Rhodococcus fascians]MBY3825674.1 signal peptidase I [Rhodococcus fascians]MBY3836136.1 signal peptidase I [Rhodococcus fascians]MBY3865348.1 signal peptidase I [Rhodococcus fascians]MBY3884251.1 signal peptidase I [Rhodococcus fascians]